MAEHIDKEIDAIKAILLALEPLSTEVRTSVLDYVLKRLQIALGPVQHSEVGTPASSTDAPLVAVETGTERQTTPTHIKVFKENKKPRSAVEMAAIIAYYLANEALRKDRKDRITVKEVETYFKIAEFPLPEKIRMTLPNAKAAGYFDAIGNGEYKLNAVGHNLVVHSMPRGAGHRTAPKKKPAKKTQPPVKKNRSPAKKK